jgi:hypothetical protein
MTARLYADFSERTDAEALNSCIKMYREKLSENIDQVLCLLSA